MLIEEELSVHRSIPISISLALIGSACLAVADGPSASDGRLMGQVMATDGSLVDAPDCLEGEMPFLILQRPAAIPNLHLTRVEFYGRRGGWGIRLEGVDDDGRPVSDSRLKQVRIQGDIYCKTKPAGS